MDRCDADQEGRTLPPRLPGSPFAGDSADYVRLIARDEATRAIVEHLSLCPMSQQRIPERLRSLELNFWKLMGFMAGSGLLGGTAGAFLVKLLT